LIFITLFYHNKISHSLKIYESMIYQHFAKVFPKAVKNSKLIHSLDFLFGDF